MLIRQKIWFSLFMLFILAACQQHPQADRVVTGKIWTGNPRQPYAEALAIVGDTIAAIGSAEEINNWSGNQTEQLQAAPNGLVVPGFIDTHTHFMNAGFRLNSVSLRDARTPEEFIQRIADFAEKLPKGTWIEGGEWDHQNWGGELPSRDWIDSVTQDHPVWVQRLDLHMGLANTAALKAAGIENSVADVEGGAIGRENGRLTGIFRDKAKEIVQRGIPAPTQQQEDEAIRMAMQHVASKGVTTIHQMMGIGPTYYHVYKRAHDADKMITRVYYSVELANWHKLDTLIEQDGKGDKWLRLGMLKGFVDGSLGSHTAAFMNPFSDAPEDSGFFVNSKATLYQDIKGADSAGYQVTTHAIGDRAIHTLLDIYEQVTKENGAKDRRFRMEHAQHIAPEDIPRFAELKVIASMQPYHAIDDGRWAEKLIGHERAKTTYAFRSLLDAGATLSFGSDWPVAPISPLTGIYAAVTRRTIDDANPEGWIPEQKITVEEALKAYTQNAAYASFEENIKGSLQVGKLADLAMLNQNILEIDPVDIQHVSVDQTIVGGKVVFKREQ